VRSNLRSGKSRQVFPHWQCQQWRNGHSFCEM